jgi:hypothetical protein
MLTPACPAWKPQLSCMLQLVELYMSLTNKRKPIHSSIRSVSCVWLIIR